MSGAGAERGVMVRLLGVGLLAALFFSSTFVLNRAMSLAGGHWVWSAALRYAWALLFITLGFVVSGRARVLGAVAREIARHAPFWVVAGGLGFGVFYTGVTLASVWAPGWVVATTWQVTILATPLVLLAFGRRVPLRGVLFALLIFAGILLVNAEQMGSGGADPRALLGGVLPVLVAALAYPAGMQMVWEARAAQQPRQRLGARAQGTTPREGRKEQQQQATAVPAREPAPRTRRWIPQADLALLDQPFARVLLLVVGSLPWWVALWALVRPPPPAPSQWLNTALVALLSGIVATVLFMQARHMAHSPYQLAAVDSTQAAEVIFSLAGEVLLLHAAWPGGLGLAGIGLTIGGLLLYIAAQNDRGSRTADRGSAQVRTARGLVDLRWYRLIGP